MQSGPANLARVDDTVWAPDPAQSIVDGIDCRFVLGVQSGELLYVLVAGPAPRRMSRDDREPFFVVRAATSAGKLPLVAQDGTGYGYPGPRPLLIAICGPPDPGATELIVTVTRDEDIALTARAVRRPIDGSGLADVVWVPQPLLDDGPLRPIVCVETGEAFYALFEGPAAPGPSTHGTRWHAPAESPIAKLGVRLVSVGWRNGGPALATAIFDPPAGAARSIDVILERNDDPFVRTRFVRRHVPLNRPGNN
jgi:hypothetical protein